jgi:hypothetical protein
LALAFVVTAALSLTWLQRERFLKMSQRYLLPHVALFAGMAVLSFLVEAGNASASDLSYCRRLYGPSLATIVRGVEGEPCGIQCTTSNDTRWAKIGRCVAMREHARHG